MAYNYNGHARKKVLTVRKGDNTPTSYNICSSFTDPRDGGSSYSALSNDAFARLSDADYEQRREAFIAYVCSQEEGLATDCPDLTDGSVVYDTVSCPLTASVVR